MGHAVFVIAPRSMSAWVAAYVAVQVALAPGPRVVGVHTGVAARGNGGSLMVSPAMVTLPVLTTMNV